jgi:hypothetical protein
MPDCSRLASVRRTRLGSALVLLVDRHTTECSPVLEGSCRAISDEEEEAEEQSHSVWRQDSRFDTAFTGGGQVITAGQMGLGGCHGGGVWHVHYVFEFEVKLSTNAVGR